MEERAQKCTRTYDQMIFNRGTETTQRGNKWCLENRIPKDKRMKMDPYLIPHTNINSKQIKDLNIRSEAIKVLKENTGGKFHDTGSSNDFSDMTPKAQAKLKQKQANGLYQT